MTQRSQIIVPKSGYSLRPFGPKRMAGPVEGHVIEFLRIQPKHMVIKQTTPRIVALERMQESSVEATQEEALDKAV